MNIKEARQKLEYEQGECWHERSGAEGRNHIMTKADAYALAVLDEALASAPLGAVYVRGWKESRRIAIRKEIEEAA